MGAWKSCFGSTIGYDTPGSYDTGPQDLMLECKRNFNVTTNNVIMNFEYRKNDVIIFFYVILCYENSFRQIIYVILVYEKFHVFTIHYDIVSYTPTKIT